MESVNSNTILKGLIGSIFCIALISVSFFGVSAYSQEDGDRKDIIAPTFPAAEELEGSGISVTLRSSDDASEKETIIAPIFPAAEEDQDNEPITITVVAPEEAEISDDESDKDSSSYRHPETGESVSEEEMIAYLKERIADLREQIEKRLAADYASVKRGKSREHSVVSDTAGLSFPNMPRPDCDGCGVHAPVFPALEERIAADEGLRKGMKFDSVRIAHQGGKMVIHPETGESVPLEEVLAYLYGRVEEINRRVDALEISHRVSVNQDTPTVAHDSLPDPYVPTDAAETVDRTIEAEGINIREDEDLENFISTITDIEEKRSSATSDSDKKKGSGGGMSGSLITILLLIVFLIVIAGAPTVVQYLKKRKERNDRDDRSDRNDSSF